jgi:hypothetical protein
MAPCIFVLATRYAVFKLYNKSVSDIFILPNTQNQPADNDNDPNLTVAETAHLIDEEQQTNQEIISKFNRFILSPHNTAEQNEVLQWFLLPY